MFRSASKYPRPFCNLLDKPANLLGLRHLHNGPLRAKPKATRKTSQLVAPPANAKPLAAEIYAAFGGKGRKRTKLGDQSRINVVSPELCDHILERLAPSLERHQGCDIIDINPGPCLWSSKLHQLLKPRTHLLVEPDTAVYERFYKPLLEEEASTYKLIPGNGLLWEVLNDLGQHLPHQEPLVSGDPRQNLPNNTLLFTANLAQVNPSIFNYKSLSQLFVHQMTSACRNHAHFQRYGLIRMLLWMDDREKAVLTPRVISQRTKFTVETEMTFESIVDVASADVGAGPRPRLRDYPLELERARRVAEQMSRDGIKTPEGRAKKVQLEAAQEQGKSRVDDTPASRVNKPFLKNLAELESRFNKGEFAQYASEDPKVLTPEYKRMRDMWHRVTYHTKESMWLDDKIVQYESIMAEEERVQNLPAAEADKAREEVKKLWEAFLEDLEKKHYHVQAQFFLRLDDHRVFYTDPPVLLWDRQPFTSLAVNAEEFYPAHQLALLDLQPKAIEPIFRPAKNYDHFEYIVATFFHFPKQSIESAMQSLAPGAVEWILPRCPSLTDVSKGGYSNLSMVSVRILTQEQWKEILTAWMDWPFKPTDGQVLHRLGNSQEADEERLAEEQGANRLIE